MQKGQEMTWKKLGFNTHKCTGCRICELSCSIEKTEKINPKRARLHVFYDYPSNDRVIVCHQCNSAPCANNCPQNAISRNNDTGAWIVDEDNCIGCGTCVKVCPFKIIKLSFDDNKSVKCDLCEGDPQCVRWCPAGALTYEDQEKLAQKLRERFAKKYASLLTSQKYRSA
jgi:Fe-S-cluster-containing hydrogenase component 2